MRNRECPWPWPASSINRGLMSRVHSVREASDRKVSISHLIAEAVDEKFSALRIGDINNEQTKEAA
jgi:hypothetical protein